MKFGFKKLGRGIKKIARKNKAGVGRLIKKVGPGLAMAAVGATAPALVVKAASAAKSFGKKVRGLETPKSLAAVVKRAEAKVRKTRQRMPGGAPMPRSPDLLGADLGRPSVGMMKNRPKRRAASSLYRTANPRTAAGRKMMRDGGIAMPDRPKKKKRVIKAPPSAKQLAQRAKFAAMAAARRKKAA